MKSRILNLIFILTMLCASQHIQAVEAYTQGTATSQEAIFNKANHFYMQAENATSPELATQCYQDAINAYKQALKLGQSAAIHYNLGNAYHHIGYIGHAILHWEKALAINPHHEEAQGNLQLIRSKKGIDAPSKSDSTLVNLFDQKTWAILLSLSFWIGISLLILPKIFKRRRGLVGWLIIILSAASSAISLYANFNALEKSKLGICLEAETPLKIAPTANAEVIHTLSAGQPVHISQAHGSFLYVESSTQENGWVHASLIGKIWE